MESLIRDMPSGSSDYHNKRPSASSTTAETLSSSSFEDLPDTTSSSVLKVKTQEASLVTVKKSSTRRIRKVRFSTLEVRVYPLCLGDNPAVRDRLPIQLDYSKPCEMMVMGLEDFERKRPPRRQKSDDLRLSLTARKLRLGLDQVQPDQVRKCLQTVRQTQQQRGWTHRTQALEPIQERLETLHKAVGNATWNRRRKSKEREMLGPYKETSKDPMATAA